MTTDSYSYGYGRRSYNWSVEQQVASCFAGAACGTCYHSNSGVLGHVWCNFDWSHLWSRCCCLDAEGRRFKAYWQRKNSVTHWHTRTHSYPPDICLSSSCKGHNPAHCQTHCQLYWYAHLCVCVCECVTVTLTLMSEVVREYNIYKKSSWTLLRFPVLVV